MTLPESVPDTADKRKYMNDEKIKMEVFQSAKWNNFFQSAD
jgi:hypothetical protein